MIREFREFATRGSLVDLAVGIVLGAAFTTIVNSFVNDILMPPIGLIFGGADFSDLFIVLDGSGTFETLAAAQEAGAVTLNYGLFINAIVNFLIVAFAMFLVVRAMNRLAELRETGDEEAATPSTSRQCPHCISDVPLAASRCKFCTSELEPQA